MRLPDFEDKEIFRKNVTKPANAPRMGRDGAKESRVRIPTAELLQSKLLIFMSGINKMKIHISTGEESSPGRSIDRREKREKEREALDVCETYEDDYHFSPLLLLDLRGDRSARLRTSLLMINIVRTLKQRESSLTRSSAIDNNAS